MPQPQNVTTIAQRLAEVRLRIANAASRAKRPPEDILLVAVSKFRSIEEIQAASAAGQRDFGENRLEELWPKVEQARALGMTDIRWHIIGTIQSRKAAKAIGPFELIHSVDRLKIARRLDHFAELNNRVLPVLLEINVSGEASKHGFSPATLRESLPELVSMDNIRIQGLMTMAPLVPDPEQARPTFRALRRLRDELRTEYPTVTWEQLSMGMTNDFEVAVEEGATIVRIGTAIFGERRYN